MPSRVASTVSQNQNAETMYHRGASRIPRPQPVTTLAVVFFVLCLGFSLAWSQNDVLTQHNDNTRAGLNSNETLLTPANVTVSKFGKLFTQSVDGIIVGQPLYASNVLMNDGLVHNVVYVATQHNSVYAFDADSKNVSPLWSVSLNGGGTSDPIADYGCTGTHYTEIGIMGTPVIDPGTTPSSNGSGTFNPIFQMQRPALLLQSGVIYIGFGGNGCDQYAYNGWLFAYNSQTLQQESAFLVTPNGSR